MFRNEEAFRMSGESFQNQNVVQQPSTEALKTTKQIAHGFPNENQAKILSTTRVSGENNQEPNFKQIACLT